MTDWKDRAERAEAALKLARTGLNMGAQRAALLQLLADGKAGQWFTLEELNQSLHWHYGRLDACMRRLVDLGLADKRPQVKAGAGNFAGYRLGYLVTVVDAGAGGDVDAEATPA